MAKLDKWERKHVRNIAKYEEQIRQIYLSAIQEAANIGALVGNFDPAKPFAFADYPLTQKLAKKLMKKMAGKIEAAITKGIDVEWELSEGKASELVQHIFKDLEGEALEAQMRLYITNRNRAREAFKRRKDSGLGLSDKVWKYSDQFKEEIEMGLDLGLRDGKSADELSRDLRQYLQYPDMLFRRVRDEHGVLHLSQRAKAFHPGRGVYRSSYKNARRLAATETNMAYRNADFTRWQNMPFVVGIKVQLSNNHTLNGEPFVDICDHLKGDYPKDFEFVGWHPLCRCFATPILMTEEEFNADLKRRLKGQPSEPERSVNFVAKPPEGFNKWVIDHADRIASAKSLPYYIRQNQPFVKAALAPKELTALEVAEQQRFIAAKSMQEAQERAVRCGIDKVDFGRATIDEANIALEVIEAEARGRNLNLAEFNIKSSVAETLNAKGAIGGAYNSAKRTLSMDISIFRESIYKKPQSWDERIGNIEAKIAKNKAEIAKFEGYLGRSKATDKELKPHIARLKQQNLGFEKQVYQYTQLKELGAPSYTLTVAEQFESIDDQARAQIYHEFGHYVDDVLGRPSQKGIRKSISQYGEKADNESFAEWYAHYRMNGPSGVPDELLEVFRGYDSPNRLNRKQIMEAVSDNLITDKHPLLKSGKEYSYSRKALQNTIIHDYMDGYNATSDTIYMLGGAPANGKSTLVDSGLLPHPNGALVIDADKVKAMIPEYDEMVNSGDKDLIKAAANFVHEESSMIGKKIQKEAFEKSLAVVIDGVNDGSFEKVAEKVASIKASTNGKRIRADYVSLDADLSVKLAKARAEKTGREVPLEFIEENNREISKLIPKLIEGEVYDELYLWDTNINGTPRLILKQIDGVLTIEDKDLYLRFLRKAN